MKDAYLNKLLYDELAKAVGQEYDPVVGNEIVSVVHESLTEVLGVDVEKIVPDAGLVSKLCAESIDSLDMAFRIEKELGIKVLGEERSAIFLEVTPECPDGREKTVLELTKYVYGKAKEQGCVVGC